jgi:hypothetical protein
VRSFIKFHRRGCTVLVLFVDEGVVAAFHATYGDEHDVQIVSTTPFLPNLKLRDCGAAIFRKELLARWLDDQQRLAHGVAPFRFVMMADTRDVFFQTDPFDPMETLSPAVRNALDTSKDASALFLVAERFDAASVDLYNPIVYGFQERFGGGSCGNRSLHWAFGLQVSPLLKKSYAGWDSHGGAVEPLPVVCSGMYLGTFWAMRDMLFVLSESLVSRVDGDPEACNASPLDQGMFNCLLYGGFQHSKFPHDVVLLNPATQPYTHMFRSDEDIRFGDDASSSDDFSFVRTCPNTPRRWAEGTAAPPSRPYAAVHQADRHGELYFYASEVLVAPKERR